MLPSMQERPPYVMFEMRAVEDRTATQETGHYVGIDTPYVIITPAGSKDRIERVASEWFAQKDIDVRSKRFPQEWLNAYKASYEAWLKDETLPTSGTPLASWPSLSPSLNKTLRAMHVLTVEDLAQANEETIQRIGMGARSLKQRAQDWLAAASGPGKVEAEITQLRHDNERLSTQNGELANQLRDLSAKLEALATAEGQAKRL